MLSLAYFAIFLNKEDIPKDISDEVALCYKIPSDSGDLYYLSCYDRVIDEYIVNKKVCHTYNELLDYLYNKYNIRIYDKNISTIREKVDEYNETHKKQIKLDVVCWPNA